MTHDSHVDFGGLHRDLHQLLGRRRALQIVGGLTLGGLAAACSDETPEAGSGDQTTSTTVSSGESATDSAAKGSTSTSSTGGTTNSTLAADIEATAGSAIPNETAGPFPADGTNGPNLLETSGVVRKDMTASIGDLSGQAVGTPVTFELVIVDAASGDPLPGAAVYLWHCTADGQYSIYELEDQNYLRAVQTADDSGRLTFSSVYPGCYPGRWPHAHFEVFESLDSASNGDAAIKTSQLALPEVESAAIYADGSYGESAASLDELSLETDGVFEDGWTDQMATISGSVSAGSGLTASLLVRI